MASLRPRSDTGLLFFDFRWQGKRIRAQTEMSDIPANRAALEPKLRHLKAAIKRGTFTLDAFFPELTAAKAGTVASGPSRNAGVPTAVQSEIPQGPNFGVFAEQWFTEFKVGWRKTYITTVRSTIDRHLLPRFGAFAIGSITRAQILEFRVRLASARGRRAGSTLSPARINTVMLILRQILQEAADRHEFTMPTGRLRPLKVPKSDVAPFTLEQVQLIVDSVRKDYRNYMIVSFFTGMRSGERHGLKWKYIDFERRLILVREAFVGGEDEYTKNDSSQRDIQMGQVVFDAMQEQHTATGKMEYVFCNRAGEPLDTNNFAKRVWYPLLRHLGLELRRPYQARHTAATLWLASGEAPEWIARQLGHASTEMLFRVYSRFVPNLTRRDGSAFDRLLNATFGTGGKSQSPPPDAQPPPAHTVPAA
jgi:integrase